MEIKDEKINQILEKSKEYREQLASNMNDFINSKKELADFENCFEEIFNKSMKEVDLNDENNIFLKCKITDQEALNGCTKKIKYKHICEDGTRKNNILNVKIPKGIQDNQKIIFHNEGNYLNSENKKSHLIINVKIK